MNDVQVEHVGFFEDAEVCSNILAVAEVGIGDMKTVLLPCVSPGQRNAPAVLVPGGYIAAGAGIVMQFKRSRTRVVIIDGDVYIGLAALICPTVIHGKVKVSIRG